MEYINSPCTDPCWNLALEQYVFDSLDRSKSYFMLWQNHNTIVVGKNQNTVAEINSDFVRAHDITVVRRLSGGGAVYHDLGNLNFTVITDPDRTLAQKWGLGDCNNQFVLMIVSKEGELVYMKKGELSKADQEEFYEVVKKYR